MTMVTCTEFRVRGRIAGFCDDVCEWTLHVFEDETLSATIAAAPDAAADETDRLRPRIVLFDGQASGPDESMVLRFGLAQYRDAPTRHWSVRCKARLDWGSRIVGTWSHSTASPSWPFGSDIELDNQPFTLEASWISTRDVRSLFPLGIGRYEFRGVFVDDQSASVDLYMVTLHARANGILTEEMRGGEDRVRSLQGTWDPENCWWEDDQGLSVDAQVDEVQLLGKWTHGISSGWLELMVLSAKRQWQWDDHANTPQELHDAFEACQKLRFEGIDGELWREIFSFCDYDWFAPEKSL